MLLVAFPDFHGKYHDVRAKRAFLSDLRILRPKRIVGLGDGTDVSGVFSAHPRNYIEELEYSYEEDVDAFGSFLDEIQEICPDAEIDVIEGNHDAHIHRWVARTFTHSKDAEKVRSLLAPEERLRFKERGIRYYRTEKKYMGLSVPGTIKIGKCLFTHGFHAGKYATAQHLDSLGTNCVHGHTHRAQSVVKRTAASGEIGAWCPGTLSVLQPLYRHNAVTTWSHGYAVQMHERDGRFLHINVPIVGGRSLLSPLLNELRPQRLMGGRKAA